MDATEIKPNRSFATLIFIGALEAVHYWLQEVAQRTGWITKSQGRQSGVTRIWNIFAAPKNNPDLSSWKK